MEYAILQTCQGYDTERIQFGMTSAAAVPLTLRILLLDEVGPSVASQVPQLYVMHVAPRALLTRILLNPAVWGHILQDAHGFENFEMQML